MIIQMDYPSGVPLGAENLNAEMMRFKIGLIANPARVVSDSGIAFSQIRHFSVRHFSDRKMADRKMAPLLRLLTSRSYTPRCSIFI